MIVFKIKNFIDYYNDLNGFNLFGKIFIERVVGEYSFIYILYRILGCLRDVVRMLIYI